MADPVSWKVIERGWDVVGSDGAELGSVHEVIGDGTIDIFNGLAVSPGVFRGDRYVPAEAVGEIVDGCVRLDLDGDAFGRLEEYRGTPPSSEIRADTTTLE